MNHIQFLYDGDLQKIRNALDRGVHLERGHIFFRDGRPDNICELIVKENYSKYKIKATVRPILGASNNVQYGPDAVISQSKYSGSIAFGNLESKAIEELKGLYNNNNNNGTISAFQYDLYSKIVGRSREDLINFDPVKFQASAGILGALIGAGYGHGAAAAIIGAASGGALASAFLYSMERWELIVKSPEIQNIKRMTNLL